MQRRTVAAAKRTTQAADTPPAHQPADAEVSAPDVPAEELTPSVTNASRAPAKAAPPAAAPRTAAEADAALRESPKFVLVRSIVLVVVFLILWTLVQEYILEPTFQPHRTAAYQRQLEADQRAQIARQVCPEGHDCEFELKPEFKLT